MGESEGKNSLRDSTTHSSPTPTQQNIVVNLTVPIGFLVYFLRCCASFGARMFTFLLKTIPIVCPAVPNVFSSTWEPSEVQEAPTAGSASVLHCRDPMFQMIVAVLSVVQVPLTF